MKLEKAKEISTNITHQRIFQNCDKKGDCEYARNLPGETKE